MDDHRVSEQQVKYYRPDQTLLPTYSMFRSAQTSMAPTRETKLAGTLDFALVSIVPSEWFHSERER